MSSLQQRGNTQRQHAKRTTEKLRGSGGAAAKQAGTTAVRTIRDVTATVRSAARRHPGVLAAAAMAGIGVVTAVRQTQLVRRPRR
ncbi:hypothetical protein ACFY2R_07290 [Micromonospora olivasterospora]|uniref:hypothetical protein n=1 Tax=Micromonospora olivasterospora TaxID=1880 RepID=UPI00119F56A6|nr:hypothetical protein [Micromonospora olivasterospora]